MNKKMFYPLIGATLLSASFFISSPTAFADEASKADSDVRVNFLPGGSETPTTPVDPMDPTKPIDPKNPPDPEDPNNPGTGNIGPLTLDFVSNIQFGEQKLSGSTQIYASKNTNPYVQVTDVRGTGAGWSLSASMSDFQRKNEGGETKVLKGAILRFENPTVKTTPDNPADAPTAQNVTFENSSSNLVLNAAAGTGQGTWLDVYSDPNYITLEVLGGSASTDVKYQSTIHWSLSDAPQ